MSKRKTIVLVAAIVAIYLVASNLEWNDYNVLQEARYNRCVISMGASTDMEITAAMIICSDQTGFEPTEEMYP